MNTTERTPFAPQTQCRFPNAGRRGIAQTQAAPKPVFASACKHLGSVNTTPLPVCLASSQLVHSKQLWGELQGRRESSSWALCPISWPLGGCRATCDSYMVAEVCGLAPGFLEKAEHSQFLVICSHCPCPYVFIGKSAQAWKRTEHGPVLD